MGGLLKKGKLKITNKTGVTGIRKHVHKPRKPGVKKRFNRKDRWIVQFSGKHICSCDTFEEAVQARLDYEIKHKLYDDIETDSSAYLYLKNKIGKCPIKGKF
jgi:hypothetical protein